MSVTALHAMVLVVSLVGAARVWAADELRYDVPTQMRDTLYPIRDAYNQSIQPLRERTDVQPGHQIVQPPQIILVDDRSRNQVTPTAPTNTNIDGHTRIGNTVCVDRDEYEEFMGWKYGRNQGGGGDNGNRRNYRRNGNYGRGWGYRRGRY